MKIKARSNDKRKINLNWELIDIYTGRWKPNTLFHVEIVKRQPTVSDPMRKHYFGHVLPSIMDQLGYDPDDKDQFHEHMKIDFFQCKKDERGMYRGIPSVFGNDSKIPIPIKKKFVDWVIRKAAEYGAYVEDE